MKIVKYILFTVVLLVVAALLVAAFIPTEFGVKRDVSIDRSKGEVFEYVKRLKNQDNFSVWAKIDPNMRKEFNGVDGTVGFTSSWSSANPDVGVGEQEITRIDEGKRIDYELRFMEPFESSSSAYMTFDSIDSSRTKVKWGFDGEMDYPMNLMLLFVDMEGELGGDLQEGLDNLKYILEK
jgi:hypothetical protein